MQLIVQEIEAKRLCNLGKELIKSLVDISSPVSLKESPDDMHSLSSALRMKMPI